MAAPVAAHPAPPLLVEEAGGVVRLTLNRAECRNAFSTELVQLLDSALQKIAESKQARVVILAAAGPVFCSGHDLSEMTGRTEEQYHALFADCARMMQRLRQIPQPVIARVHGMATAAGCQLAVSCDLVVAAEGASFAAPGVKIGLFCTTPMVPLVRSIPPKVAMEMLLTGAPITARRAYEVGLVNRVVPAEQLDSTIDEFTRAIVATSSLTMSLCKAAFYDQLAMSEADAYPRAVEIITGNALTHDAQEGIAAFLQKRPASWNGT